MQKPKTGKPGAKPPRAASGAVQAVAGGMTRWLLMLAVGLGTLGVAAGFLGQWVVASTMMSIVFVAFTLYLFLKYWPEEEERPKPAPVKPPEAAPGPRQARVSVTRVDGPPKARFVMALKEVVRRQDSFRLSPQGAERFARTIRFMLRNSKP